MAFFRCPETLVISYSRIEAAQELLAIGEDLRHCEDYAAVCFGVLDRGLCFHSIRNAERPSLTEATVVLWAEDRTYAQYLSTTFELQWAQLVPAEQRIKEFLEGGLARLTDELQLFIERSAHPSNSSHKRHKHAQSADPCSAPTQNLLVCVVQERSAKKNQRKCKLDRQDPNLNIRSYVSNSASELMTGVN